MTAIITLPKEGRFSRLRLRNTGCYKYDTKIHKIQLKWPLNHENFLGPTGHKNKYITLLYIIIYGNLYFFIYCTCIL
jgi:hypothetical protein